MKNELYRFVGSVICALLTCVTVVKAAPTYYSTRSEFLAATGASLTDGYASYTPGVYSDADMSAVVGEAVYSAITFPNQNQVGPIFGRGDGTNYCSGCNGNFRLVFDSTSFAKNGGTFGVGLEIVLHTSRRVSIGDDDPNNPTYPGSVLVQFADGSTEVATIPPDIGYYEPSVFFFGITDPRGIASITIGTEPTALRHFWIIDNLTVAADLQPDPLALLVQLAADVLDRGPGTSFFDKATLAQGYFVAADKDATCSALVALSKQIAAQSGKTITADESGTLLADVDTIEDAVGCP